jgi:PIN domain nuclease of toxin-antitoxin system
MSVIATLIEPQRVTRIFFDCSDAAADPADRQRIEQAIEASIALAEPDDDVPEMSSLAA